MLIRRSHTQVDTDRVQESTPCVISNNIHDPIICPSSQRIAVVQPSDCWRYQSFPAEIKGPTNTKLRQPRLIPSNLLTDIEVGSLIFTLVSEGMRDMHESISILISRPPILQRIKHNARFGERIISCTRRPKRRPSPRRLHVLGRG